MASSSPAAAFRPRKPDEDVTPSEILLPCAAGKFSRKIQPIYNGKYVPITMQAFAQASENPAAQEQWKTMEKQCGEQSEQSGNPGEC
jgi:hypothetical protein